MKGNNQMNKNRYGEETKWSLFSARLNNGGRDVYFWVGEDGLVKFERTISQIGWSEIPNNNFESVGKTIKEVRKDYIFKIKKIQSHSMVDEHLEKGWLLL